MDTYDSLNDLRRFGYSTIFIETLKILLKQRHEAEDVFFSGKNG